MVNVYNVTQVIITVFDTLLLHGGDGRPGITQNVYTKQSNLFMTFYKKIIVAKNKKNIPILRNCTTWFEDDGGV